MTDPSSEITQPSLPRPLPLAGPYPPQPEEQRPPRKRRSRLAPVLSGIFIGLVVGLYLFAPLRVNILFLGVDRAPEGTTVARTDTMILATVKPLEPYVGMLSIPRDLWVNVPGFGMNRINTAHFFAENSSPGTGPQAAMDTVEGNFGVNVNYYVRLQFQGFRQFVDALGGVEIELEKPTGGYPPGRHLLNGEQALAFVRDRKGTDDFFRMSQGQIFIRATLRKLLHPASWVKIPGALPSLVRSLDTDIPLWQWPRLAIALLRTGPDGLAFHSISREMATGFTTDQGAQVLAPNWSLINPVLREMFGQ